MNKKPLIKILNTAATALLLLAVSGNVSAAKYNIDPSHSFVEFSILHLGYSVLKGRFNKMSGSFEYDEVKPYNASIEMEVDVTSIDSNHAERDKHLRSDDFLDVAKYPRASFKSTGFKQVGNKGEVTGELTLHGVTRSITMPVEEIGAGPDPWGGFRRGFKGQITLARGDYGVNKNLGPKSNSLELMVFIEGIRE